MSRGQTLMPDSPSAGQWTIAGRVMDHFIWNSDNAPVILQVSAGVSNVVCSTRRNPQVRNIFEEARPEASVAADYRAAGWWRDTTFTSDLQRAAVAFPDRTAMVNWRHGEQRVVRLTFRELAENTARAAEGLRALGVRRGDAVAYQLPDWWETAVLALACDRVGAVAVPCGMATGARELERVLSVTGARVCVVPEEWNGIGHAQALADMSERLPRLAHRIVIAMPGNRATPTSAECLLAPASATYTPPTPLGADNVSLVLFTSGTTGDAKGVLHSPNTLYAASAITARSQNGGCPPRVTAPLVSLTHAAGLQHGVLNVILNGTTAVFSDVWHPETMLDLLEQFEVEWIFGPPMRLGKLTECLRRRPRALADLRTVVSTGTSLPRQLVPEIREHLCQQLLNHFGMTELGGVTRTRADDPPEWAGASIGKADPGVEIRLMPVSGAPTGTSALHVRSPALCLGSFSRDSGRPQWRPAHTSGWLDTGDLVRDDGRGGFQHVGRVADRVAEANSYMVPVLDVENELRDHPSVRDVAVIGYPAADYSEQPCAVVVPNTEPLTLGDLRAHLAEKGMTSCYLPTRLEIVRELPRNAMGKVRKDLLRQQFAR